LELILIFPERVNAVIFEFNVAVYIPVPFPSVLITVKEAAEIVPEPLKFAVVFAVIEFTRVIPLVTVKVIALFTETVDPSLNERELALAADATVTVCPVITTGLAAIGILRALKPAPVLAFAAFPVSTKEVLLVIDETVPISVVPFVLYNLLPIASCVVKVVPTPVTVVELVAVVIVPVKFALSQVSTLFQFPVAIEVIVCPCPLSPIRAIKLNVRQSAEKRKICFVYKTDKYFMDWTFINGLVFGFNVLR
jgi:hypothetical protein